LFIALSHKLSFLCYCLLV